ncbi:MAG: type IIA DNA topoisomerase subunit B [Bacteroidaceae bacterium]|nr:type IIA DNA topoisomerase subunit B [Bacteroidaceae bacterium]
MAEDIEIIQPEVKYGEEEIRHLSDMEHVRTRPGMYIGRLGDGTHAEDGIYVLLKEVIDNSIDEFKMNAGKRIEVDIDENLRVTVRDYGRGIPLGKLIEAVSMLNTGGKYDSKAFKKSVGLNGVGLKAVNALSSRFVAQSFRDGETRRATFEKGLLVTDEGSPASGAANSAPANFTGEEENGTMIFFEPDDTLFKSYRFQSEFVETLLRNYTYLNTGLTIMFNGHRILSRNGLEDLLIDTMTTQPLYPIVHLKGEDIEIAFTHTNGQYGEEYHSFVNGQHTTQGGTHQSAFKKYIAETIKDFSGKNFDYADIRNGIVAAISIDIQEPLFESQTKIKLGSLSTEPNGKGVSIDKFIGDFVKQQVDNYLRRTPDVAEIILQKVGESERERKAMAGVAKLARERSKKANLHNRKLRDCRIHFNDPKGDRQEDSCIFITEGDSASGSITKSRDVLTQAVFSLRGKPLNCYGLTKKVVYENEEFNLLQAALNIEDGLDGLRYNKVIVATDADVDGMHIRLLMITFFLQFFPELIKKGHVYILQTPLFRVRQRRKRLSKARLEAIGEAETRGDFITRYCYSEEERLQNIEALGPEPEITRFKGLGEISPDEFRGFIGPDIRLEQVSLHKSDQVAELLEYYMGKNTMERQNFIIDNLVIEEDRPEEEEEEKEYKELEEVQ